MGISTLYLTISYACFISKQMCVQEYPGVSNPCLPCGTIFPLLINLHTVTYRPINPICTIYYGCLSTGKISAVITKLIGIIVVSIAVK